VLDLMMLKRNPVADGIMQFTRRKAARAEKRAA